MRVMFVLSETLRKSRGKAKALPLSTEEDIPLGISYIASVLEQHNHAVDLFMTTTPDKCEEFDAFIEEFKPDVIGFSMVFREFFAASNMAKHVKEHYPNIYIFAGGAHVTLNPMQVLNQGFDAVCVGEGEYPVLELVEQLAQKKRPSGIHNFWFRTKDGVEKNETREYITDLDSLPFPNRKMWQKYVNNKGGIVDILVGRGCAYNCTYCCNHALKKTAKGRYVRYRSPENIIEEIKEIIRDYPDIETIFFETEAINLDESFLENLAEQLHEFNKTLPRAIVYGANIRLHKGMNIPKVIDLFVKANIVIINIGLESGSERVRKEILNRPEYTNDDLRFIVKLAKKHHRHIMIFALLGLPGETLGEARETIEMVKECRPSFVHLGIFTPYPGTILYDKCVESGIMDPKKYKDCGRHRASFDTQYMTKWQIEQEYYKFFPRVYARNKKEYIILRIVFYMVYRLNLTFMAKYGLKYIGK